MSNKTIVFQVTKEYMKKNKKRTLITFAGIAVMVVLMTAVFIGRDTALDFLTNAVAADKGSWHAQVYELNAEQVEMVKSLPYTEHLEVSRPLGYMEFAQSGNPDYTPYLEVKGYTRGMFDLLNIHLKEGRFPENENEIVLSERAIKEGATVSLGDVIEGDLFDRYMHAFYKRDPDQQERDDGDDKDVIADEKDGYTEKEDTGVGEGFIMFANGFRIAHGETKKLPDHFAHFQANDDFEMVHKPTGKKGSFMVVGIMEVPYYETEGMGGYIALAGTEKDVTPEETVNVVLQMDLNQNDTYLNADLCNIVNSAKTEEEIEKLRSEGMSTIGRNGEWVPVEQGRVVINETLLLFASKGMNGTFYELSIFFQAFFIILITVASMVLIYNVFSISFHERCRYLGMLSSVGATRAQKRSSVYAEVLLLLAFALPLGILGGLAVIKGGMALLYPHFANIISLIAENVITGRSCEIGYHLIVKPGNLLLVVLFSVMAVCVSAWIPARRVGKIGPIESIRGNDEIKAKKGKTLIRFLKKGRAERLLAVTGITRNSHCTRGIIRSICAFLILTTVTAFSANTMTEIIKQKANDSDFELGTGFQDFDYCFYGEKYEEYAEGLKDIKESNEVSAYRELCYDLFALHLSMEDTSDEYRKYLEKILKSYFPEGIPEDVDKAFLHPARAEFHESCNMLVVTSEEFESIRKRAHLPEVARQEGCPSMLVYDTVSLSTDEYKRAFSGAKQADYAKYEFKHPIKCAVGEQFTLLNYDYEKKENQESHAVLAGYVSADDIKDFIKINDGSIWMIITQEDNEMMAARIEDWNGGLYNRMIFFQTQGDDGNLLRRLSAYQNEWGGSALVNAKMSTFEYSFHSAIIKIIDILAVCFILLVSVISLLNLYNSVMGRRLARQRELATLISLGITKKQLRKMLCLENGYLLLKSILYGSIISAGFVVSLHSIVSWRFGKLLFRMPISMVSVPLLVSVLALMIFTEMCYRRNENGSILEEIRAENV